MANFIQKNNTGSLFLNERKTETKHPDYTGKVIINNKPFWVSAWIKVAKNGNKFISVSFQEPFNQMKKQAKPQQIETTQEIYDEGYGEPQQDDFNKKVDEFANKKNTYDDTEEVPF